MGRLIDADAVAQEILLRCNQEIVKYKTMRRALGDVARTAYECVKNAEAVDAEPVRHGKWMICYYNEESKEHESVTYNPYTFRNPDGAMFCSECGLDALRNVHAEHVPSAWCPHCGAKMDLEDSND